jgi:FtsH-binding integral membrane protein
MSGIDERIRQALQEDAEEKFISAGDDQAMIQQMLATFRGRNRWLAALAMVYTLVFFALAIVCAVQFFWATETKDQIMWATACMLCWIAVGLLKSWWFMQMDKMSILREVKRLELQVARLSSRSGA